MNDIKKRLQEIYGREPSTLDELGDCIKAVAMERSDGGLLGLVWDVKYKESVSNSHYSPVGYPQNWRGNEVGKDGTPLPVGYPGYFGRVWLRFKSEGRNFGSSGLDNTLTYTGTGGFGAYHGPWEAVSNARFKICGWNIKSKIYPEPKCYSYDFRFFMLDWPEIANSFEKYQVWQELSGTANPMLHHQYGWIDPETEERDTKFINKYFREDQKKQLTEENNLYNI